MEYTMQSFIDNIIMKSEKLKEEYTSAIDKDNNAKDVFRTMCSLYNEEIIKGDLSWFGSKECIEKLENNTDYESFRMRPEKYFISLCTQPKLLLKKNGTSFVEFLNTVKDVFSNRIMGDAKFVKRVTDDIIDTYSTLTDTKKEIDFSKYMKAITHLKFINNLYLANVKTGSNSEYAKFFNEYSLVTSIDGVDGYTKETANAEEAKEMLDELLFNQNPQMVASGVKFFSEDAKEAIKFFAKEGMIKMIVDTVEAKVEKKGDNDIVTTMCNIRNLDVLKRGYRKYQSLLDCTSAADEIQNDEINDKKILNIKTQNAAKKYIFKNIGKKSIVDLAPAMIKYKQLSKAMANEPNHGKLDVSELKNTISELYKKMEADNYAITSISNTDKYNKMSKCLKKIATTNDKKMLEEFLANHLDDVINTVKTYRNYKLKDTRNSQRGNNRLKQSSKILDVLSKFKDDFEYSKTTNFSDIYKDDPKLNNNQLNYWVIHEDNLDIGEKNAKHADILRDCKNYYTEKEQKAFEQQQKLNKINKERPNLFSFLG